MLRLPFFSKPTQEFLPCKLLLVEDDQIDRMAFERMVRKENLSYEFDFAISVKDAKEKLRNTLYDIILLDYLLGDGTAFDLLDLTGTSPVVITTGGGDEEIAVQAMRAGAFDYVIKDKDRNYLKILPIIINNALRRQHAEALSSMLSHAITDITDSVYITTVDDEIIFVNKAFCRTYGYSDKEIIGKHSELLWKDPSENIIIQSNHARWEAEVYHLRKDGEEFPVSITRSTVQEKQQKIIVSVSRDTTARKLAEQVLRRSEETLRQRNEVIEKDLHTAQLIQKALLPSTLPNYKNIQIEAQYHSMDRVGGDYFSLTPFREGGLGIFIGDVAGHGVSAAFFLSLVKASTDRTCRKYGLKPAEYLEVLNTELIEYMPSSFITAIYGFFKVDENNQTTHFTFAKGGHPWPIYSSPRKKEYRYIKTQGTLVGIYPNAQFEEKTLILEQGDRIYLYTDGISEITNPKGEMLTETQLLTIVKEANRPNLKKTIDLIVERINEYNGDKPITDDMIFIGFEIR